MKIVAYSCVTPGYDRKIGDGRIYVEPSNTSLSPRMQARERKVLYHKLDLPDHDWSIWIDSHVYLPNGVTFETLLERFDYAESGVYVHPNRKTIDEEIKECTKLKLDEEKNMLYHKGKPGLLAATGVLIRKNTKRVHELCEVWWDEILKGSSRDQLSFPYTLGSISSYRHKNMYKELNIVKHLKPRQSTK